MDSLVNKLSVIELEIIRHRYYCTILLGFNFLKVKQVILIFTKQSTTLHPNGSRTLGRQVRPQSTGFPPRIRAT